MTPTSSSDGAIPFCRERPPSIPGKLTKDGQAKQFGYNNDYLGYFPLPGAPNPSEHGLLCVNHEYTNEELMFPGLGRQDARRGSTTPFSKMTREIAEVEMMAHGGSVLEVRRTAGKWAVVGNSKYARRITGETEMRISGPAAGHDRMKTGADPSGSKVLGMLNNCAGGRTPWGTWLTCEENINGYFSGQLGGRSCGGAQLQADGHSWPLVQLGRLFRSLQPGQGAQRGQSLRLGRGDRSLRSGVDAGEAHRARPLQATRAPPAFSTRTAATSSIPETISASSTSTSS